MTDLLGPDLIERLERLALRTRGRVSGAYPGAHRSRRLGSSVDFADWRQYVPGDDFRRIDYQIYARLDRLLVRLYEAEDEVVLHVLIDGSSSMAFEGKFDMARRLGAALAYLTAVRGDRARLWLATPEGLKASPWARSRDSAAAVIAWLGSVTAGGRVDLPSLLTRVAAARSHGGVTVVLSDLLSEDWEDSIRRIAAPGTEGALLHLLARSELDPAERGDLLLVDAEGAAQLEVSVSEPVLRAYRERAARWVGTVAETCRRSGLRYSLVHPDDDLEALLLVRLRDEGLVG